MPAAVPIAAATITAGGSILGANSSAKASESAAKTAAATTQAGIDEQKRQFDITNPQTVAEMNLNKEEFGKTFGEGTNQYGTNLESTEAQVNAANEAQKQRDRMAAEASNAQLGETGRQFNVGTAANLATSNMTQEASDNARRIALEQANKDAENRANELTYGTESGMAQSNAALKEQGRQANMGTASTENMFNATQKANLGAQDITKTAYQSAIKDIAAKSGQTEEEFMNTIGSASPEIQQMVKDIATKGARSMEDASRQTGANLQAQGVRGGQAATLMNRAVGDIATQEQNDINQILAQDAQNRQATKAGYLSTKAGLGNEFLTSGQTAQMYDAEGNPTYESKAGNVNTDKGNVSLASVPTLKTPSTVDTSLFKSATPASVAYGDITKADTSLLKDYNPINTEYTPTDSALKTEIPNPIADAKRKAEEEAKKKAEGLATINPEIAKLGGYGTILRR